MRVAGELPGAAIGGGQGGRDEALLSWSAARDPPATAASCVDPREEVVWYRIAGNRRGVRACTCVLSAQRWRRHRDGPVCQTTATELIGPARHRTTRLKVPMQALSRARRTEPADLEKRRRST